MATLLRDILGEVESSIIYKNEGNHPTMHVFEFKTRQQNLGLINIIKFLKLHTKEEPKLLTPGLKAAATRFNLEKLKSGSAKAKENKSLLLKLQDRIEALEKLITQQVPTKPKYNGLTVLENITEKKVLCRCECGKAVHAYLKQVQDGAVKTCGKVSCKNKYKNSRSILRAST